VARQWLLTASLPIVAVLPGEEQRAKDILARHIDKDWTLCDAISFAVLDARRVSRAFTFDHHFRQFGRFQILGLEYQLHLMRDCRRECKMCTFGTAYPAVSREGENSTNSLKNCAKTAAKINVRQASELDEFQHIRSGYLEFYTNRAQPPNGASLNLSRFVGGRNDQNM